MRQFNKQKLDGIPYGVEQTVICKFQIHKSTKTYNMDYMSGYTVKNGVFQNSFLGCLNVHSSTTPNRVSLKPLFEGVTGHPQNTLTIGSESLLCKYLHTINSQLYVIVSDLKYLLQYLIVLLNKKKSAYIIILCCYKRRKNSPCIFFISIEVFIFNRFT